MTVTPIVRLDGVSKSFGRPGHRTAVLHGVNLTIRPGEKASLVGPSGSGKSTLLSLIAGLLRPDDGTIEIDAVATGDLDDRARAELRADRIGIALQSDNLIPFLTARENVELAQAFTTRRGRAPARDRALALLERFGVVHRAEHRPRQLSGGEAQRVALAVSMANEPALLLADEVVAQLDGRTAARVIDDVLEAEFAVLYVTHEIAIADLAETRYALTAHGVHPR
jgi:putative ABC transport system ATP-binding protein